MAFPAGTTGIVDYTNYDDMKNAVHSLCISLPIVWPLDDLFPFCVLPAIRRILC